MAMYNFLVSFFIKDGDGENVAGNGIVAKRGKKVAAKDIPGFEGAIQEMLEKKEIKFGRVIIINILLLDRRKRER